MSRYRSSLFEKFFSPRDVCVKRLCFDSMPRYKHQRRFMHECLNLTLHETIYVYLKRFDRIRASLQHDASWTILPLKLINQICLTSANWAISTFFTGDRVQGRLQQVHAILKMVKYRSASLPSTPSLYSAECDQNKQKSTQSSSSSAIDHDHPTKRCLDPPRMLTLPFFVAVRDRRLCLSSTRKRSKIFPKRKHPAIVDEVPTKSKLPRCRLITKNYHSEAKKLEEGNGYRPRTVPGSSRGREEKLANYCGWE